MCRAKQSRSGAATTTTNHHYLGFNFILKGALSSCSNCVESLCKRQSPIWLEHLPSLSMRFLGEPTLRFIVSIARYSDEET